VLEWRMYGDEQKCHRYEWLAANGGDSHIGGQW